jgi:TRAP-type C4-dicarboxylate transport system substrate-binding protein
MKKLFACLLVVMIAASIAFAGCAAPAPGQPVEFKLNIAVPGPQQPSVWEPTQRFIKNAAEKSNGRIKITIFPNFGLAPGPETFDATVKGICDLGEANTGYSPGRFPATDATILPLGYPSSVVQSHVMLDFYEKFKPKEWEGVIPLDFITPPPFWLATTKKPVRTLDDLKGLQVRVTSKPAADLLTLMGAAPRVIPITETYEQLAKGVMDGVTAGPEAFPAFKFNEVCKYFTDFSHIAMGNCSYMVANVQTFGKLSAADQKLMRELGAAFGLDRAKTWDYYNDIEIANLKKAEGKEAITMAPAEQQKMRVLAQQVVDNYIKDTTAKGLPAADYVKYVKERIDYWSKQK